MADPRPLFDHDAEAATPPGSAPQRVDPESRSEADERAASRQRWRDALDEALSRPEVPALIEAGELYGDDIDRELEDIKAGRHPLQRGGRDLDASEKLEAELAAIREKLGR